MSSPKQQQKILFIIFFFWEYTYFILILTINSLDKMKNYVPHDFVQQFPHLKSEWRPIVQYSKQQYFQNIYSQDECQIEHFYKISMKELDLYSIRQAYSFPFCPKIYKYRIQKNYFQDNEIKFDIKVLTEKVSFRLNKKITLEENKMLSNNLMSILKAYEYLCKRFGRFYLKPGMIGWTNLNIVKIWFNEDFGSNKIAFPSDNQADMVHELIKILSSYKIRNIPMAKTCKTLQGYIEQIVNGESKDNIDVLKPLHFKLKQKISDISSQCKWKPTNLIQPRMTKAKKNTTFSFSSKDILSKKNLSSKSGYKFNRNSIKINQSDQKSSQNNQFYTTFPQRQEVSINNSQLSSLKVIKHKQKKKSIFCPDQSHSKFKSKDENSFASFYQENEKSKQSQLNSNKNSNCHLGTNHRSSYQTNSMHQNLLKIQKPELLHYSTSTNPCNKFINFKSEKNSQKNHSFAVNSHKQNGILTKEDKNKTVQHNNKKSEHKISFFKTFQQQSKRGLIDESEQNHMKSSQEIKNDLDALFHSTHDFDSSLLQKQFDKVFESSERL